MLSLLELGLQSTSEVKCFIYSKEFFETEGTAKIFNEGLYKDVIYADLFKYMISEFDFYVLKSEYDYVWGYFVDINDSINGITYILVDTLTGKLKHLKNNSIHINIY